MLNSKKDKYLTIKANDFFIKKVEDLSKIYFSKVNKTSLIELSVKTLESLQSLADKHTKGSIEVLLFKIEEMPEGKK